MPSNKRSRSFVSHAATYAIGNVARRFIGFAMLPIYTRFLTPTDYGAVGLLTFALSLFETLLGARVGAAIPRFFAAAEDSRGRRNVIWGALLLASGASAVSVVLLILFRGIGSQLLFGNRIYSLAFAWFSINLVSQPVEQTGMTYLRLKERSGLFFWFSMGKLALQVCLNLLLVVYWREGVLGVVLSGIISSVLLGLVTTAYIAVHEAPAFDWSTTRRMIRFCWPLWMSGLAGLYIGSSGSLFLRMFGTLSQVGLLSLALRFATVVVMMVWGPFYAHWEPMSFQYHKEEADGGRRKFQVAFIVISVLMFAGGLGISIFATPVIRVMAAKSFSAAAAAVPILTLGFILNSIRQFSNFSFFVTDNTRIYSFCQYGTALVVSVACLLLVPKFGFVGAALAQAIAFIANFIYVHYVSRRYFDAGLGLKPVAGFAAISIAAYLVSNAIVPPGGLIVDLLIKSLVTLVGIALIAWVGIRSILAVEGGALTKLPWPLDKLGRIRIVRQMERQLDS
jgi:O-antigen/teichoic acid export membrane protein